MADDVRQFHRSRIQRVLLVSSIWFSVALIAVLNPLACLIHCAAIEHTLGLTSHTPSVFACTFPRATDQRIPRVEAAQPAMNGHVRLDSSAASATSVVPRAVYEALPLVMALLAVLLVYSNLLTVFRTPSLSASASTPPAPPPRFA